MIEGLDHDDKFRMVEDELLTIAQTFTTHLHAAEYKRQQKMVKSRNADTIDSISRPVAGKMPDHTRRRVEAVARAKAQQEGLEGLLGKKNKDGGISDDSDEDVGLSYIGTTLYGLMDSPRKKAALISNEIPRTATTRAAAGFNKPAIKNKTSKKSAVESPKPKVTRQDSFKDEVDSDTSDDDDLDAPISAPKLLSFERRPITAAKPLLNLGSDAPIVAPNLTSIERRIITAAATKPHSKLEPVHKSSSPVIPPPEKESASYSFDDLPEFLTQTGVRPSRIRARQLKAKQEAPKKRLDEIPSFL